MTDELYQQVILEHNRKPRNFGTLDPCTHKAEGFNPVCGDHYTVYMEIDSDGRISKASFDGAGCAISKASASMMTQSLIGKTKEEADTLFQDFHKLVTGTLNPENDQHVLGKLAVFSGIWKYPARVKCAALSWHAMHTALEGGDMISTE
jgi:nitrogen fixation NifU-like protein